MATGLECACSSPGADGSRCCSPSLLCQALTAATLSVVSETLAQTMTGECGVRVAMSNCGASGGSLGHC